MAIHNAPAGLAIACTALWISACGSDFAHSAQTAASHAADQAVAATVDGKTYDLNSDTTVLTAIDNCEGDYVKAHKGNAGSIVEVEKPCMQPYIGDTFTWTGKILDTQTVRLGEDAMTVEYSFGFNLPSDQLELKASCQRNTLDCMKLAKYDTASITAKMTSIDLAGETDVPSFVIQSITKQ